MLVNFTIAVSPKDITFYEGISFVQYEMLVERWPTVLSIIQNEVSSYVNNPMLCFDTPDEFPNKLEMTGDCRIDAVSYSLCTGPTGFQIMVSVICTSHFLNTVRDYLGLDITLFTDSTEGEFTVWGVDSYVA